VIIIAKRPNLIGKTIGHLTIIAETVNKKGAKAWLCECDCKDKTQLIIETARLVRGLKTHCGCRKERKDWNKVEIPKEYINKKKICNHCGEEKYYSEYYFKEGFDLEGNPIYLFNARCIECDIKLARIRTINHRDEHLEALKKNNQRENIKMNKRAYSKKQKESGYYAEYLQKQEVKDRHYSARRASKNHRISKEEWIACKEYFNNSCAYCGLPIEKHYRIYAGKLQKIDLHKEHMDDEGSIYLDNCIPSCGDCNDKKWKFTLDEWYNENNPDFTQERYDKIMKWINEDHKLYIEPPKPKRIYKKKK